MHLKPDLKAEVRALLDAEGWDLGTRYIARRLRRGYHPVVAAVRELRVERSDTPEARHACLEALAEIPVIWEDEAPTEPHGLAPEADRTYVEKPATSYALPPVSRLLIVPDTHAPFHDAAAWKATVAFARGYRPDGIVHLGDMYDFYSVSDHDKDPRRAHNLVEECKVGAALLDDLDALGARTKIFCEGNHEFRLERYLMRSAPALLGAVSVDGLLHLQERGWLRVPYGQHARIGNLHVTHDVGKSGQQAVHQTAVAVGHNVAFGHTHRMQQEYFGTVLGERYVSTTCGWLGDSKAATYVSEVTKASWQLGFAAADMQPSGDFHLVLRPIVDGRVV